MSSKKSMDLSTLSSDLPPTKSVNDTSMSDLSREITNEFKNAARSVASLYNSVSATGDGSASTKVEFANAAKSVSALYRITHNNTSLVYQKGYLDCLDDLLELITVKGDVENWALTKRAEITNSHNNTNHTTSSISSNISSSPPASVVDTNQRDIDPVSSDFQIPSDYDFTLSSDIKPNGHFRSSITPLSLQHTYKQRLNIKTSRKFDPILRRKLRLKSNIPSSNSQDEEDVDSNTTDRESQSSSEDDADSEAHLSKRKGVQNNLGPSSKKKKTL
ncbi:hypothetical protein DFJ63DRAFT_338053 [Scheffersomyces coipomensis]|uniref:uncharacterized protein n=1 Tax=Scheffersomyces coipomensis TaxID=1788519 RepID=UPI00315D27FA